MIIEIYSIYKMVDVAEAYFSLPIVTRVYLTLVVGTSIMCALDVCDFHIMLQYMPLILHVIP